MHCAEPTLYDILYIIYTNSVLEVKLLFRKTFASLFILLREQRLVLLVVCENSYLQIEQFKVS